MASKKDENITSAFSKEQILKAKKYENWRDILAVVLDDGKSYSHNEIKAEIDKFLKQEFDKKEVSK